MHSIKFGIVYVLLFVSVSIFSQDIIVKENGEEIKCKIYEEDSLNIYFSMRHKGNRIKTHAAKNSLLSYHYDTIAPTTTRDESFMFELSLVPFGSDGIISLEQMQIKFFPKGKTALRLGAALDIKNNKKTEDDYDNNTPNKTTYTEKSTLFEIKPGIEFRIFENSRVSPYWGIELIYKNKSSKSEYTDYIESYSYNYDGYSYTHSKTEVKVTGAWKDSEPTTILDQYGNEIGSIPNYTAERAYNAYGANLLFGTDFFIIKNLYMGFEFGFGYELTKYKQIEVEEKNRVGSSFSGTTPSFKSSTIGFYYNNAIRLGIYF